MSDYPSDYPEHDKLSEVKDISQEIGMFLDLGLPAMGLVLAQLDPESDRLWPTHISIEKILAEYFDIDLDRIDEEKRAMLEALRA